MKRDNLQQQLQEKSVWHYLPPEVTTLIIEGDNVLAGRPGDVLPVANPSTARLIYRPTVRPEDQLTCYTDYKGD